MNPKLILSAAPACAAFILSASEPLPVKPFSEWQIPKNWTIQDKQLEYRFTNWSSASTVLNVKKSGTYRVTFNYQTPGTAGTPLKLQIGGRVAAAYPPAEKPSRATVYFHAENDGECPFAFLAEGKKPYTLKLGTVRAERLNESDLKTITLNAKDSPSAFRAMEGEALQTVETKDHIDAGFAYLCRGNGGKALRSIEIPAQPGKTYRLTFWAKGSPGTFQVNVDGGWFPNVKYWYVRQIKRISGKWTKYALEFTYPTEEAYPYLKRRLVGCQFAIPAGQTEFLLKDLVFEQLP